MLDGVWEILNDIITPNLILVICSILGIFGNINIVWASIRRPNLRSTCNFFIATTSIFDVLHQLAHIITAYILLVHRKDTTLEECFYTQFFPVFGCVAGSVMLLMISLDRLFCVCRPGRYKDTEKHLYAALFITIPCLVGLSVNYAAYKEMIYHNTQIAECIIIGGLFDWSLRYFFLVNIISTISTMIVYIVLWKSVKQTNHGHSRQILRSITAVSCCVLVGWMCTMGFGDVVANLRPANMNVILLHVGVFVNISLVMNYVIYFVMSKSYRDAFKQQLRILTFGIAYKRFEEKKTVWCSTTVGSKPDPKNAGIDIGPIRR